MKEIKEPILVIGGTGHYGKYIVKSLLQNHVSVRLLTRSREKSLKLFNETGINRSAAEKSSHKKIDIIEGDILNFSLADEILTGIRGIIICLSAFNKAQIHKMKEIEYDGVVNLLNKAKEKNINRIVYISVYDINLPMAKRLQLVPGLIKNKTETYLKTSSFNWTILGVPASMDVFFTMIRGKNMMVPGGGPAIFPCVNKRDVGEIAAKAVLRDDLTNMRIRVPGPDSLNFYKAADCISNCTGKKIQVKKIPMIIPRLVYIVSYPFGKINNTMLYIRNIMGYARLLNKFPPALTSSLKKDHQFLVDTFGINPMTFEMEVKRRIQKDR